MLRLIAFGHQAHDETGTGRTERKLTREAAELESYEKALECGVRRIVKRFAMNLDSASLEVIDRAVRLGAKRQPQLGSSKSYGEPSRRVGIPQHHGGRA